jgi:hypothetical protein
MVTIGSSFAKARLATESATLHRFLLTRFVLEKVAGLSVFDVRSGLTKFLWTLSEEEFKELGQLVPYLERIMDVKNRTWSPAVTPLVGGRADAVHRRGLAAAKLRLVREPEWFYGPNGWFLWLAQKLAGEKTTTAPKVEAHDEEGGIENERTTCVSRFGLAEFESALWLAVVSRLAVVGGYDELLDSEYKAGFVEHLRLMFDFPGAYLGVKGLADEKAVKVYARLNQEGNFPVAVEKLLVKLDKVASALGREQETKIAVRSIWSSDNASPRPIARDLFHARWDAVLRSLSGLKKAELEAQAEALKAVVNKA